MEGEREDRGTTLLLLATVYTCPGRQKDGTPVIIISHALSLLRTTCTHACDSHVGLEIHA